MSAMITASSSREFDQDGERARKAAAVGPAFITDRGVPAHVLLGIEAYRRPVGGRDIIIARLGMPPGVEDLAAAGSFLMVLRDAEGDLPKSCSRYVRTEPSDGRGRALRGRWN